MTQTRKNEGLDDVTSESAEEVLGPGSWVLHSQFFGGSDLCVVELVKTQLRAKRQKEHGPNQETK